LSKFQYFNPVKIFKKRGFYDNLSLLLQSNAAPRSSSSTVLVLSELLARNAVFAASRLEPCANGISRAAYAVGDNANPHPCLSMGLALTFAQEQKSLIS